MIRVQLVCKGYHQGPNCLFRLSADDINRQRVDTLVIFLKYLLKKPKLKKNDTPPPPPKKKNKKNKKKKQKKQNKKNTHNNKKNQTNKTKNKKQTNKQQQTNNNKKQQQLIMRRFKRPICSYQSELPRPIPWNQTSYVTSRIYFDNVTLTLHNVTLASQKPCQHNNKCDCSKHTVIK